MRVLVTGAAGYVGSHVAVECLEHGDEFVVVDSLAWGHREAVQRAATLGRGELPLRVGDLCDRDFVDGVLDEGFDVVVHCAAFKSVAESVEHPERYERNNVLATKVLAAALQDAGPRRVVYASSGSVYGNVRTERITEDTPLRPINPYGRTKAQGEHLLALDGFATASLRFFNVCGAHPSGQLGEFAEQSTNLMPVVLERALSGRPVTVFGDDWPTPDGTCVRDYVHVGDIAAACRRAALHTASGPGRSTWNVGTGRGSSVLEVIAAVEHALGRSIDVEYGPRRPGDPAVVVADVTRIRDGLGFEARYDLADMASHALAWAQLQHEASDP